MNGRAGGEAGGGRSSGQPNPRPLNLISFVMALRGPTEGVTSGIYEAISHSRLRNFLLRAIVQRGGMILCFFFLSALEILEGYTPLTPSGDEREEGKGRRRRERLFTEARERTLWGRGL